MWSIFGWDINVSFTSGGHYFVWISCANQAFVNVTEETQSAENIFVNIENLSIKSHNEKLKITKKLHCQIGHANPRKLRKLVESSSIKDDEFLKYLFIYLFILLLNID